MSQSTPTYYGDNLDEGYRYDYQAPGSRGGPNGQNAQAMPQRMDSGARRKIDSYQADNFGASDDDANDVDERSFEQDVNPAARVSDVSLKNRN